MASRPRRRFGQNFLTRQDIISRIMEHIDPKQGQKMVEIGPGRGALTRALAASGAELTVIEIDRDLAAGIRQRYPAVDVITADVLKTDLSHILHEEKPVRVVGNLPYNISTPLLFRLFAHARGISDMHFMLQLEVVNRIIAPPGSPEYGRLSVMSSYFARAGKLLEVPPEAFTPAPRVTSAVVELVPHTEPEPVDTGLLGELVTRAFNMRRKTIRNSLGKYLRARELEQLGIDPDLRAGNLALAAYLTCARYLAGRKQLGT